MYGVLDRLEEWGWIVGTWVELPAGEARPRRRYYRLTPTGRVEAAALLAQRRPATVDLPAIRRRFLPGGAS
ncbi:PadR family transcriptional regulator [Amycolatopsis sp. NPDC052450]|uniref:PadR family transcriptional regulator n=1 Tax=Amycolatopsis sp. NPDC052450 TaxID=3363937 RepID=UPI0037C55D02